VFRPERPERRTVPYARIGRYACAPAAARGCCPCLEGGDVLAVRPAQVGLRSGLVKVSGTELAMSPAMQSGHLLRTLAQRQARQRRRAPARRGY
jgi:hypothetical protein